MTGFKNSFLVQKFFSVLKSPLGIKISPVFKKGDFSPVVQVFSYGYNNNLWGEMLNPFKSPNI